MKRHAARQASRAVAYIRVSTEDQNLGPQAQRAALERWSAANGVEIVALFEEHVSGGVELDKRPQLLAALNALALHSAGVLIVAKRDRLARDVMVAAMVERLAERQGARVLSADGTGNGSGPEEQLMRHLVAAFAEYERQMIKARTKAALAVKRGRGERVSGRVPFGFRLATDATHLEADPEEQRTISLVQQLRADGRPLRAIVERLNTDGVPARGGRWHLTSVARLLRREAA
jgi:DNA invertase Pin-like site-specific DNA recombinase